jgi:prepilin-type N-terminal cleavage/methylation domain-containing protein
MNRMKPRRRSMRGMSLLEMLAAMTIMSIAGAGIAGLLMLNGMTTNRLSNKVESLNSSRLVIERIGKDVRMARNIGDVFGTLNTDVVPNITEGSDYFPSPQNPQVFTAVGGWPWGYSAMTPMKLSSNTLIVQVPVFDANGFPTGIGKGVGTPPTQSPQDNVDTYVYRVVTDTDEPGTWKLEVAGFAGPGSSMQLKANPPTTILRGIVGPIDPNTGIPGPFNYISRDKEGDAYPSPVGFGGLNANLTGVSLSFEMKATSATAIAPSTVAIKSEVYMRNNALSTVNASP